MKLATLKDGSRDGKLVVVSRDLNKAVVADSIRGRRMIFWARAPTCRGIEVVDQGNAVTSYMKFGDRVRIEMRDAAGNSIFGAIDQRVVEYVPS